MSNEIRIQEAVNLIERFGGIDGEHHKQWLLDQTLRVLLGESGYAKWLDEYNAYTDEDGEEYDTWDVGIAP